jgi:hypothetical protein
MKQAGVSQPVIDKYVEALGLTDGTFESIIKLSGQEEARRKLDELNIQYQDLPPVIYTQVQAAIDEGDFQKAYDIMKTFLAQPVETPVETSGAEQAGADAHQAVADATSDPVTQGVKSKDLNSGSVKQDIVNTFLPPAWQGVNTKNDDRWYTKNSITGLFGIPVPQDIATGNDDRTSTKGTINRTFQSPIQQEIQTYNNDAHSTRNQIANVFSGALNFVIRTAQQAAPAGQSVGGQSAGRAARPSSAEVNATATPSLGLMATTAAFVPAPVTAGVSAPMGTPPIINLSVNMPIGTNEARVVDLLRSYARSNGRGTFRFN